MATCRIEFRRSAEKDLRRIAKSEIPRILAAIQALAENPLPEGSRKLVGSDHTYRIRVGDYRVIYHFLRQVSIVEIERIRHRKDAYRE